MSALVVAGAVGARGHAVPPGAPFDGRYAYQLTKLQLSFGPRPAGSAAQRAAAARLVKLLPGGHFEAIPGGLRNIVGQLPGRLPAILLVAHYDTTPVPGYLGANNGAAGVGAVIAIAKALRSDPAAAWGQVAVRFLSPTARRRLPVSPISTRRVSAAARPTPPRTHASFAR